MIPLLSLLIAALLPLTTYANPAGLGLGLESLSLAQVYALPVPELETRLLKEKKEACDALISSVSLGRKDPANLTPAQLCAVQDYSGAGYLVNKKLWETEADGKALTGNEWAYVRVLDSALAKIKTAPPATVYRGAARKDIKFTKPGQIVRLKGYTSTSPNRESAESFITDRLMVIQARSGKNIKIYSNAGAEDEFLLPRSTKVRFERAEETILELFTEEGPKKLAVEIVHLTELE